MKTTTITATAKTQYTVFFNDIECHDSKQTTSQFEKSLKIPLDDCFCKVRAYLSVYNRWNKIDNCILFLKSLQFSLKLASFSVKVGYETSVVVIILSESAGWFWRHLWQAKIVSSYKYLSTGVPIFWWKMGWILWYFASSLN